MTLRFVGFINNKNGTIHAIVFEDRILEEEDVIGIARQYDE